MTLLTLAERLADPTQVNFPVLSLLWTRCPEASLIAAAASTKELLRAAAARHPKTPPASRAALRSDSSPLVVALANDGPIDLLLTRDDAEKRFLEALDSSDATWWTPNLVELARDLATLAAGGELVETSFPLTEHLVAASSAEVDAPTFRVLAQHPMQLVLAHLALRQDLPLSMVRELVRHHRPQLLEILARRSKNPEALKLLVHGSVTNTVIEELVMNPVCPPALLERLAATGDKRVLLAMLSNPTVLPDAVYEAAVANHNDALIEALSNDAGCPLSALELLGRLKPESFTVLRAILKHPLVTLRSLEEVAKSPNAEIRGMVALHPKCDIALLSRLGQEEDATVLFGVIQNPACPSDVLARCAAHSDVALVALAAKTLGLPTVCLAELAASEHNEIRVSVAKATGCPKEILEALARDSDQGVRRAVVGNDACPKAILETLAKDKDFWVADDAKHRLEPRNKPPTGEVAQALEEDETAFRERFARKLEVPSKNRSYLSVAALLSEPQCPESLLREVLSDYLRDGNMDLAGAAAHHLAQRTRRAAGPRA